MKTIGNCFAFDMKKPTHWRPLPEPPTEGRWKPQHNVS
ncbi:DUF551 domain-containing protein [Paraburkholderia sediminicola]